MTYLVSPVHDQVFPVYLFIKEMERKKVFYDQLLFITSRRKVAKERAAQVERALSVTEGSIQQIEVPVNDLKKIAENLENSPVYNFSNDDSFIVNLSCEATIMAIGVYQFFSKFNRAEFYFIPPGENVLKNVTTSKSEQLMYRVNVWEYFTLNGLHFEHDHTFNYSCEKSFSVFERFKRSGYNHNRMPEMKNPEAWFREYVYHRIQKEMGLEDGFIHAGLKVYSSKPSKIKNNEIDIAYIFDNELYTCVCVISLNGLPGGESGAKLLETHLNQLAAISVEFGLKGHQLVFTLHRLKKNPIIQMESVLRQMKTLHFEILADRDDFNEKTMPLKF